MSTLKTNNIQHVDRSEPSILINTDGSVNIAGTMTYEDVTNVDSVGIITARKQLHVGTGVSIAAGGLNITAGVSTVQALQATTGTFSGIVQSAQFKLLDNAKAIYGTGGDMEIYHNATNTVIQNGTGTLQIVNTGSDLYQQAAANITFNTNGSNERVRITSNGDVRVGGGSPATFGSGTTVLETYNANTYVANLVTSGTHQLQMIASQTHGATSIGTRSNHNLSLTTNDTNRVTITTTGKATFTTPGGDDAILIKGDNYTSVRVQSARDSASDHAMFQMLGSRGTNASPTIVQSGDTLGTLSARGYDGNSYASSSNINFGVDGTPGDGDMPGRITFSTAADGSESPTERMRIQANGYINIGTGTAEEKLTVRDTTQHCLIRIISGNGTGQNAGIDFGDADDTDIGRIRYYHDNNYMRFDVNGAEALRIDSNRHIVNLSDSSRLKLGAGQDFEFYHDGTNSGIHNLTGDLYIENDSNSTSERIFIRAKAGEDSIRCHANGAVEIYHDGASDSSYYSRYDGATFRNNNAQGVKDCNIDLIGRVDGNVQLHFYADDNTDNNKKFKIRADSGTEALAIQGYYTGGYTNFLECSKGSNNNQNLRIRAGKGGIRFDDTCEDYRDIDGDGHLFRRDGQAQLGVDDFFYIHDIDNNDTNNRIRVKFDSNAGTGSPSVIAEGTFSPNTGLDFAEYFEWSDGNPSNEDRIGHTVSVDGLTGKIKIAEEGETVIGVISGTAGFTAGSASFSWKGRFKHDEWGREVYEQLKDENGNLLYADAETRAQIVKTNRIETEEYDPSLENSYVPRELRKEWDIVGLLGQIRVRKTAVIPSNWVKLKEIDSVKDLYLVK